MSRYNADRALKEDDDEPEVEIVAPPRREVEFEDWYKPPEDQP